MSQATYFGLGAVWGGFLTWIWGSFGPASKPNEPAAPAHSLFERVVQTPSVVAVEQTLPPWALAAVFLIFFFWFGRLSCSPEATQAGFVRKALVVVLTQLALGASAWWFKPLQPMLLLSLPSTLGEWFNVAILIPMLVCLLGLFVNKKQPSGYYWLLAFTIICSITVDLLCATSYKDDTRIQVVGITAYVVAGLLYNNSCRPISAQDKNHQD